MYVNWPADVLAHPGFEEVSDPVTGTPVFRGPRLRMGLAEGQPNSVLPDHTGRANYYGSSVNRAARYADVAAHGGQVVLDVELLHKVCSIWAAQDAGLAQACVGGADGLPLAAAAVPASATPQQPVTALQQSLSVPLPLVNSPLGRQQQLLPSWSSSDSRGSASAGTAHGAPKDVEVNPAALLEPASRCSSETLQQLPRRNRDHHVAFSFSFGTRASPQVHQSVGDIRGLSLTAARSGSCSNVLGHLPELTYTGPVAPNPDGASLESIVARHIGFFAFKGSGQSHMASVLHDSIAQRTYPDEPPKGKGERLGVRVGTVDGLDKVQFRAPAPLLAARQLFKTFQIL